MGKILAICTSPKRGTVKTENLQAVSYTHLDVYKRQVSVREAAAKTMSSTLSPAASEAAAEEAVLETAPPQAASRITLHTGQLSPAQLLHLVDRGEYGPLLLPTSVRSGLSSTGLEESIYSTENMADGCLLYTSAARSQPFPLHLSLF